MTSLSEPPRACTLAIDTAYTVLDLIIDLERHDSVLGIYSLRLPKSGLISPSQLKDTVHPQLRGDVLDIKIYHPISYRNSFNFINNLIGLDRHGLLETTNLTDVEPINHAKLGEWIGFGRGPVKVPPEENNRLRNLIWVVLDNNKPVCYNVHCLYKLYSNNGRGKLLMPHLNQEIQPEKFLSVCAAHHKDEFRVLRIKKSDICK